MNSSQTFAPSPPLRRRRQWRAEPLVFAVLLTMLTLGINLSDVTVQADQADQADSQPAASHMASAR